MKRIKFILLFTLVAWNYTHPLIGQHVIQKEDIRKIWDQFIHHWENEDVANVVGLY